MQNFGFLLIDKPVGWTSFDVCAKLRKQLGTKKIGHTGTLDPFATGLLVVAVGKATKLIPFFEKDQKTYETEVLLGHMSETLDTESEILKCQMSNVECQIEDVESVLSKKFLGKIQQVPPKYSALKIGGKKMCDMARKGEAFEIKPREAEVLEVEVLAFDYPKVTIRLKVAAGFYVRSFARDLGEALGLGGGICQQLRRTGVGKLGMSNDELRMTNGLDIIKDIESVTTEDLISPEKILRLPRVEIEEGRIGDFLQGRAFPLCSRAWPSSVSKDDTEGVKLMVLSEGRFLGIGEIKFGNLQPRLGFQGE